MNSVRSFRYGLNVVNCVYFALLFFLLTVWVFDFCRHAYPDEMWLFVPPLILLICASLYYVRSAYFRLRGPRMLVLEHDALVLPLEPEHRGVARIPYASMERIECTEMAYLLKDTPGSPDRIMLSLYAGGERYTILSFYPESFADFVCVRQALIGKLPAR